MRISSSNEPRHPQAVRAVSVTPCEVSPSLQTKTARPVEHPPIAVSVVADTTMEADAWATALVVLGPERGHSLAQARGLAALFVTASGSTFDVRVTDAFRAHLAG